MSCMRGNYLGRMIAGHPLDKSNVFFQGHPFLFQQNKAKPHSAAWLVARAKKISGALWSAKTRQQRTPALKSYIQKKRERIPPTKLQQLASSLPKHSVGVTKRKRWCNTVVNVPLSGFLATVARSGVVIAFIFLRRVMWPACCELEIGASLCTFGLFSGICVYMLITQL